MICWNDQGIVLSVRSFGERSALVSILTERHGCHAGLAQGVRSKKKPSLQVGDKVFCTWKARLSEHLGLWSIDTLHSSMGQLLYDPQKLFALNVASVLTVQLLPERHPYPEFFLIWVDLLDALVQTRFSWIKTYIMFELNVLQTVGFGLKISSCGVTKVSQDLAYVSPKTGCAVTKEIGRPYEERLLPLPSFLSRPRPDQETISAQEVFQGLDLTGHFLKKLFLDPKHVELFRFRQTFIDTLKQKTTDQT